MSSKSPINPTISTPATGGGASGTSTHIPSSILRATPSTVLSTTITPHADSSPPDDLQGSTSSAPPKKRTRGPNRSKGTSRLISENKLDVTYNKGELHPYGDNASRFASEIGIIVRDHAPLRVKGWSKIDNGDKKVIYTRIKDKFNLNLNDTDLVNIIDSHCSNRYKNHRNNLHGYYKSMIKNGKNPRAHPRSKVRSNEDREWLCDNIFSNPQWLKRSEAATGNRGRLTVVHRAGSKSFIGHRSQVSFEGVFELGRIELFKETHWNASHGWINEEAETRYS